MLSKTITIEKLVELAKSQPKGFIECVLYTQTQPKLTKKHRVTNEDCPFLKGIRHIAAREVFLGKNYEDAVNAARIAELKVSYFVEKPLWKLYGEYINDLLRKHKENGELYLAFQEKLDEDGQPIIFDDKFINLSDSSEIDLEKTDLSGYLPLKDKADKKTASRQKVRFSHRISWKTVKLVNVAGVELPPEQELLALTK